jgi:AcrR family transcriptional regulator
MAQNIPQAKQKRVYQSAVRERQAADTRQRIATAGRRLLTAKGYAAMTIDAVAQEAGVAAQTVYAVFGSKIGILNEILDEARFDETYQELVRQARSDPDPRARLRYAARIARQIFDSERPVLDLLRGAGVLAPELSRVEHERESMRYERQGPLIEYLAKKKFLRPGLKPARAREILWAMTSRDLYRMLVRERGWPSQEFEDWLGNALVEALMGDSTNRGS